MESKMTEEMVVRKLLSEYPIKELQDQRQTNALVATLLNGEKRMIEFEKTIVPAEVVGRYIVVDHSLPIPGIPMSRHHNEEIGSFDNYAKGHEGYYLKAEHAIRNATDEDNVRQIMLVGEFKGKKLDFVSMGVPDINTGITLGSVLTKSDTELSKGYVDKEPANPNLPVTINNKLYVQLDREIAKLKFEQSVLQGNELDVEFWKVVPEKGVFHKQKNGGNDEDVLLHKRKNRHDMTTEKWVNDPLLSKRTGGKGHGKGI